MGQADLMSFLPMLAIFAVLYFLMIRPQMKRQKEQRTMLEALQKGDEVIAGGGLVGRLIKVGEQYITIEVGTGTEVIMQRSAVQTVLPKGSIKAL